MLKSRVRSTGIHEVLQGKLMKEAQALKNSSVDYIDLMGFAVDETVNWVPDFQVVKNKDRKVNALKLPDPCPPGADATCH